jgi:exodeoxyribonuclease V alpha subunit
MTTVLRGPETLVELNRRGVLDAVDVHVATRLSALARETSDAARLALALCLRGLRAGSVVLDLTQVPTTVLAEDGPVSWPPLSEFRGALDASPLVGGPLHREGDLLWLDASWRQEVFVAEDLLARAASSVELDHGALAQALARLWPGSEADDQRAAAAVCALSRVSVLGGGPGTGKTTTVSRLLVALAEGVPTPLRIALAAPTGKAAARLAESLQREDEKLSQDEREWLTRLDWSTLHRLLGARQGSGQYWYCAGNRLPYDVVVVDEASMVSLTLFARLLEALRPGARLVLVGDPDQLASVEAGAVLADLVTGAGERTPERAAELAALLPHDPGPPVVAEVTPGAHLRDGMAVLTRVRRYGQASPIDRLARAVRAGEADEALDVLRNDLRFVEVADDALVPEDLLRPQLVGQLRDVVTAARDGDARGALNALGRHRLLCAHRTGPRGVKWWDDAVPRWLVEDAGVRPRRDGRFAGQPLMVRSNDYDNGLWNGDTGVVIAQDEELVAFFATGGDPKRVPLGLLGDVRPMYAMTVHRAQGSQSDAVTVVLPPATSPLGTRETLYTAVTRAETAVTVIGSSAAWRAAVARPVQRASGLPARLA